MFPLNAVYLFRQTLLALLAYPLCAVSYAQPASSAREIVIGQTLSLQGGKNAYAAAVGDGINVYVQRVNSGGGVKGRRIVQRILDDDGKADVAATNAKKLIDEGALVLFGAIDGGVSSAVMKVAIENTVPFIGPIAGSPNLREPHQALVFPVRAEHKEEFRKLLAWGKTSGLQTVGFLHADTEVGRAHLKNVQALAAEQGISVSLALPFKSDASEVQIQAMAKAIADAKPAFFINHGSAALYEKLIVQAKAAGAPTFFTGVNSGSFQIAKGLGAAGVGMVFTQVVPSPWERKTTIVREYQSEMRKRNPQAEFSYGSLEGYITAKLLVAALRGAGANPTRSSVLAALKNSTFDLGNFQVSYKEGEHTGSRFVDISVVGRDGNFKH
jgi:branched-chain amino acid transport system substrate-binding protein